MTTPRQSTPHEVDGRARWDMFRDVWRAMYDEEPPAMPLSGQEAWELMLRRIAVARESGTGNTFPRLLREETHSWR